MTKHNLIITISALALFSCGGGGQNQNNSTNSADSITNEAANAEEDIPFSMEDVVAALGNDGPNDFSHDYVEGENLAYYQRGESVYSEHYVKAYPLADNSYHVVETFTCVQGMNESDYEGETHYIKEYTYCNGKATEVPLQEELKPYATKYNTDFSGDLLRILYGTEPIKEFKWDGTKYVEQEELFAYEILKRIVTDKKEFDRICKDFETNGVMGEVDNACNPECWGKMQNLRFTYKEDDMYPEEGYLDCFPMKDGGYFVLFRTMSCGDYEHWTFTPFIYNLRRLFDGSKMMPVPGINDYYSNASKFPKEAVKVLSDAMQNPVYSLQSSDKEVTLLVRFEPYELDERGGVLPVPLKGFQRKDDEQFPGLTYRWVGDGFSCTDSPRKEDLKYFDPVPAAWKSAVAYQAAQKLGVDFPNQKLENQNHYRMWEDVFNPPSYNVFCFPLSAGGTLVLYGEGFNCLQDYKSYIFKDGELSETNFTFPACPLSELLDDAKCQDYADQVKILEYVCAKDPKRLVEYQIDSENLTITARYSLSWDTELPYIDFDQKSKLFVIGKYQDLPKFKWDGEKFVRQ